MRDSFKWTNSIASSICMPSSPRGKRRLRWRISRRGWMFEVNPLSGHCCLKGYPACTGGVRYRGWRLPIRRCERNADVSNFGVVVHAGGAASSRGHAAAAQDVGGGLLTEHLGPLSKRLDELTHHRRLNLGEAARRLRFPALPHARQGRRFQATASATLQRKQLWIEISCTRHR